MNASQLGECLSYVVSRSGKVLDSCGRVLQEIAPANVPDISRARPLASFEGQPESFFNLAALLLSSRDSIPPGSATKKRKFQQLASRKPAVEKKGQRTCVWDDDIGSLEDVARAILRRQKRVFGRKSSREKSENTGGYSERHRRLVHHLKVGVSQMYILQRWQKGSRELPARWASWLLKMLRRTKPPPQALQRFLFTVSVAILPVICCSLVCQTLSILPDSEVLKSVDILCNALVKSWWCFSPFQWEILEERIYQCQQVRLKAGTWLERRKSEPRQHVPLLRTSMPILSDKQRTKKADDPSLSSSSDEYTVYNDEQLSNELVLSEGVKALVRRALRERQILPSFKKNLGPCIDATAIPVSTLCPLSGTRVKVPARGVSCTHLSCFDLECYLKENAELASGIGKTEATQKPMWRCPYCGCDATWPQIIVDGFILRILKALPGNIPAVLIWPDGRWSAMETSLVEKKANSSDDNDDHYGGWSRGDTAISQQEGRNVKRRLDETDESTWDVKDERSWGSRRLDGDFSGNEASCVRVSTSTGTCNNKSDSRTFSGPEQPGGPSHDDHAAVVMKQGPAVDLSAAPSGNVPVLHAINLRDLIQSTLEKARSNETAKTNEQEVNGCGGQQDCFKPVVTRLEPLSVPRGCRGDGMREN